MKYFDIHSHLNLSPLKEDQEKIIKSRGKEVGTITVGVDYETSLMATEISRKSQNLLLVSGFIQQKPTKRIRIRKISRACRQMRR